RGLDLAHLLARRNLDAELLLDPQLLLASRPDQVDPLRIRNAGRGILYRECAVANDIGGQHGDSRPGGAARRLSRQGSSVITSRRSERRKALATGPGVGTYDIGNTGDISAEA